MRIDFPLPLDFPFGSLRGSSFLGSVVRFKAELVDGRGCNK